MPNVLLIVGAGPGLGTSIGRRFAAEGFKVAVASRTQSKIDGVAASIDGAKAYTCDVTSEASVQALYNQVTADLGEPNVAIFNASGRVRKSILDIESEEFINAWMAACHGGFLVGREAARRMIAKSAGTILFTGATASVKSNAHSAGFAVGKFGLRALAFSMARELGPKGVHVGHVIVDGGIRAEHRPDDPGVPDKWLNPDDIAESYWHLHAQGRSSWTAEIDVRPWVESF
jgi:NAD(P)-dependent dehydrogenase (short-subunit alcohol dehydrogenase family)